MAKLVMTLIALALVAALPSCKIGCKVEDAVSPKMQRTFADLVDCENRSAVEQDVKDFIHGFGMCNERTGLIGTPICSLLAAAFIDNYANAALPAKWGVCKAADLKAAAKTVAGLACSLIPVRSDAP